MGAVRRGGAIGADSDRPPVARLERLRLLPPVAAERANGGSLTADVANHFAVSGFFRLR